MSSGLSDERACGRAERSSKNELVSRFPKVLQKQLTQGEYSVGVLRVHGQDCEEAAEKKEGDTRQR